MERPDFFHYDHDQATQPEDGISSPKPQVSRLAGHLTLGNRPMEEAPRHVANPKAAETVIAAALQPEKNHDVQFSSWHRIEKDDQGHVKTLAEQRYGQALLREMDAEQGMPASTQTTTLASDQQTQVTQQPTVAQQNAAQPSSVTQPQPIVSMPMPSVPVLPNFNHQQHRESLDTVYGSQARPVLQNEPTQFGQTAVNPSLNQPLDPEHQLEAGAITQDPEHMLPAPKKSWLGTLLKSPWFWLAVGVGLIFYFA